MTSTPAATKPAPATKSAPTASTQTHETARIARTASIISLGNITSRLLGLARDTVKSHYFGAGGAVDAFNVAARIPVILYDLLVGRMVDSSLVPVFIEYAEERREELWGLISILLSLVVAALSFVVLIVELIPGQIAYLLSSGSSPEVLALAARLLRITAPALIFLSLSGVLSGTLFALKRFSYPAFTAAVFNASMVVMVLLFHNTLDVSAMALGLLIGAVMQVALQLPGLRDARLRFHLTLSHPALRRVVILFAPILLGLVIDNLISQPISYNLASLTGEGGISWMGYATTLREVPQGLVAVAVSVAILPTLSAHATIERQTGDITAFRATLARGLRLVTFLIIPATVGLFVLARPVVALLFEHGDFVAHDTQVTTRALEFYLLGVPFAAVDLLLVTSFYARQDTLTPSLIGIATVIAYLALAVALLPTLGLYSLMIADSFKLFLHALISGLIQHRRLGGLRGHGLARTLAITVVASALMGGAAYVTLQGMTAVLPGQTDWIELAHVAAPGLAGVGVYLGLATLLRVEEMGLLWGAIRRRLGIEDRAS